MPAHVPVRARGSRGPAQLSPSRPSPASTGQRERDRARQTRDRAMNTLRLMCVLAHPDDESLGTGGTLAKYAAEGIETYLVTATRGERGRFGDGQRAPGRRRRRQRPARRSFAPRRRSSACARSRSSAIRMARSTRSIRRPRRRRSPGILRRVKPHVVITFGPEGAYGHPDHIAISQLTHGGDRARGRSRMFAVSKLYYIAWSAQTWAAYQAALKKLTMHGGWRRAAGDAVRRTGESRRGSTRARCGRRSGAPCSATRRR